MDKRLHELNRSLRGLDEAYRLGEITRDDYRARRRRLLAPLHGGAPADPHQTASTHTRRDEDESAASGPRSWLSAWRERLTRRR
ncbi:MAG: hypothetical protein EPN40_03085 [Rhodanobacteraceae bacterium]|nr:MAG: hypothetical protein EPN40_03085 [Rhodanobacteraceae bacterium]